MPLKSWVFAVLLVLNTLVVHLSAQPSNKPVPSGKEKAVKNQVYSFNLSAKGKLVIENEIGDITVETWEKPTSEVSVFKTSSVPGNFNKIRVDVDEQPSRVKLKTVFLEKLKGDNSIDYIVTVPATVDLQLKTTSGKIQVKGLAGRLSLQVEKGDIRLENVAGAIEGRTEVGNILLAIKDPVTNDISLRAEEGTIRLNIPTQMDAFVWAESEEGAIRNDLKFETTYNADPKLVKGQMGKGGKLIRLQATKGTVALSPSASAPVAEKKDANKSDTPFNVESRAQGPPSDTGPGPKDTNRPPAEASRPPVPRGIDRQADQSAEPPPNFRSKPTPPPVAAKPDARAESQGSGSVVFKVNTNLISLNANVQERTTGRSPANLQKEDFLVYEDNVLQQVAYFGSVETPFSLLLLLDISGSMEERFDMLQEASIKFTQMLRPQDRIAVATFSHEFRLVSDFTNDRRELARAILGIVPGGGTAFYDALYYSVKNVFRGIKQRKAIVIFTDGADNQHMPDQYENGSVIRFPEVYRLIEESEITIYPIFLNTEGDPKSGVNVRGGRTTTLDDILDDIFGVRRRRRNPPAPPQKRRTKAGVEVYSDLYANAIDELYQVAEQTGGKMYAPSNMRDLNGVYEQIVDDLSIQYTLGYYPTNSSEDGRWRRIIVKVKDRPGVAVRTRKGYYANFTTRDKAPWTGDDRKGKRRVF